MESSVGINCNIGTLCVFCSVNDCLLQPEHCWMEQGNLNCYHCGKL